MIEKNYPVLLKIKARTLIMTLRIYKVLQYDLYLGYLIRNLMGHIH